MIQFQPTFLFYGLLILTMLGLLSLSWGKKTSAQGLSCLALGLLALFMSIAVDAGFFIKKDFHVKIWKLGWIWPQDEKGALTFGLYQDALGLTMSVLGIITVIIFLINKKFFKYEKEPQILFAGLAFSTIGITLSWNSLTPWVSFSGLTMTLLGGFLALVAQNHLNQQASLAARFMWERSSGILIAFLGTCILAVSRYTLVFHDLQNWQSVDPLLINTWIGLSLVVLGACLQMQPFPWLGWIIDPSHFPGTFKVLFHQIFPAWSSFALLLRISTVLQEVGLFPILGSLALVSAALIVLLGLFQNQWQIGLQAWIAAGFSLMIAFLAWCGVWSAFCWMIGISLASLNLFSLGLSIESKDSVFVESQSKKKIWIKVSLLLSGASGTGMIGFVSATGAFQGIFDSIYQPVQMVIFIFIFFIFNLLGWSLVWKLFQKCSNMSLLNYSWTSTLSTLIWIFLSLGIVWTGSVTGGVVLGNPDQIGFSLLDLFFDRPSLSFESDTAFLSASGVYCGLILIAFLTAYWTSGREEDQWLKLARFFPRTHSFITQGYRIDDGVRRAMRFWYWLGQNAELFVEKKLWSRWLTVFSFQIVRGVSQMMNHLDSMISLLLVNMLRYFVYLPARGLQSIQTGDVQWYLFFGIALGFLMLAYFLNL